MAKILVSLLSGLSSSAKLPCFQEGLINALMREGNDVMLMITNTFLKNYWHENKLLPHISTKKLNTAIQQFDPALVITFNHSLYDETPKQVDCPIIIWGTDSAPLFVDKKTVKKKCGRYQFIQGTEDSYTTLKDYFGVKPAQFHAVPYATDFVAENLIQDKNISFVGTNFLNSGAIKKFLNEKSHQPTILKQFKTFLASYKENPLRKPDITLLSDIPHADFLNLLSANHRTVTLKSVHDLGLHLYGSQWYDLVDFSLDLALCYNTQEICTVKENQDLYNQSKIAINITHSQAGHTFGERVRDIMATNACLVSDYREDLNTQFGKHVKIPAYHTSYEARELCQKLLKDEPWRKEIVENSQRAIEDGHRFHHRLKKLEGIFNIPLFHPSHKKGILTQLHAQDFTY